MVSKKNTILREENESLKRKLKDRLPDADLLEELEGENKNFRKEIRGLKRDNKEISDIEQSLIKKYLMAIKEMSKV